jgi:hypothetical protein
MLLSSAATTGSTIVSGIYATVTGVAATSTGFLTTAVKLLTKAFKANPIGFIITAATTLIGVIAVLYNKFEIVRKAVWAFGEAAKTVIKNVGKFFGKLFGMEVGDYESVGEAWGEGAAKGAESWKKSQEEKSEASKATDKQFDEDELLKILLDGKSEVPTEDNKTKEDINAVSGGGQKVYNITINKMIETLTQYVSGGEAAANGATEELEVAMARMFQSLR